LFSAWAAVSVRSPTFGFALLITVQEASRTWLQVGSPKCVLHASLDVQRGFEKSAEFEALFGSMMSELPPPVQMPINAARSARRSDYGWGHHGGGTTSGSRITVSSRELMELLAGRRTAEETSALHDWRLKGSGTPRQMPNPFERALKEGRLPTSIKVVRTGKDDNDDWLEFDLGSPDPAISPFR